MTNKELESTIRWCDEILARKPNVVDAAYFNRVKRICSEFCWVPIDERLPEYGESVLVDSDYGIMVAYYDRSGLWFGLRPYVEPIELIVYAWMKLPEGYNGGN